MTPLLGVLSASRRGGGSCLSGFRQDLILPTLDTSSMAERMSASSSTSRVRVRAVTLRKIHRYIAMVAAAFLLLVSLTGSLLVFRRELHVAEPQVTADLQRAPRLELELLIEQAAKRFDAPVGQVRLSHAPHQPVELSIMDDAKTVAYYSSGGTLIASHAKERQLTSWIFKLHTGAIAGRAGELSMLLVAAALLMLLATGYLILPWRLARKNRAQLTR